MDMKLRRGFILLLALCLMCGVMALSASAKTVASGDCGDNGSTAKWTLDSDGVLTISGNGKLTKRIQDKELAIPDENIKKLVVEEGITALPASAFESMKGLKTVVLADSITTIGANAFGSCYKLATVYYDGTAAEWAAIVIGENNEKLTGAQIIFN